MDRAAPTVRRRHRRTTKNRMAMTAAVLAANRFGLGARPGELAAIGDDPRGWLKAQLSSSNAIPAPVAALPGTDHGTATALFLGGGAVAGRRVIAQWPGLEAARLFQNRDLAPTMDFRSVAKAVLRDHLGLPQDALDRVVFPESGAVKPVPELLRS